MAAFVASAHAKLIGEVGLRYATSRPGAVHLLTGLYDADMGHVSVVAICFQQAQSAIGASYQQEVDLLNLFKDLTSECVASGMIQANAHPGGPGCADRQGQALVTATILPNDLQLKTFEKPPVKHGYRRPAGH